MWVAHKELKKIIIKRCKASYGKKKKTDAAETEVFFSFFFSSFILRFSSFCPSEFVGINTESALCDEGYA